MLVGVYPRSFSADATRRATAELGSEPGNDFHMPTSNADDDAAFAGAVNTVESGSIDAATADSGAVIRAFLVSISTTSSSDDICNCTRLFFDAIGANANDSAAKFAPRRTASALLSPIMIYLFYWLAIIFPTRSYNYFKSI